MYKNKRILAVVPARSGSKGITDKNISVVNNKSLIGWAAECLNQLEFIDTKIISTDSEEYVQEANRYNLSAPFLRPDDLSTDTASAVDTMIHAVLETEKHFEIKHDIILIIEPTSPLRKPEDIQQAIDLLIETKADSVVTVSPLDTKYHPKKILNIEEGKIRYFLTEGSQVAYRQSLDEKYWRNGICYALTRESLLNKKQIITQNTQALVMDRIVANIDAPMELEWAEYLMKKEM